MSVSLNSSKVVTAPASPPMRPVRSSPTMVLDGARDAARGTEPAMGVAEAGTSLTGIRTSVPPRANLAGGPAILGPFGTETNFGTLGLHWGFLRWGLLARPQKDLQVRPLQEPAVRPRRRNRLANPHVSLGSSLAN